MKQRYPFNPRQEKKLIANQQFADRKAMLTVTTRNISEDIFKELLLIKKIEKGGIKHEHK